MYDFKLDIFFKFMFCQQSNTDSMYLLHLLIENVINQSIGNVVILNGDYLQLNPKDKGVRYDIKLEDEYLNRYDIEMQNSSLSKTQIKRFGYYGAKLINDDIRIGDNYNALQQNIQIILINQNSNHSLIETYIPKNQYGNNEGHHIQMKDKEELLIRYYIYLPYINEIVRKRSLDDLNDFELMIYIINNGVDENVKKLKRKVVEIMERMLDVFYQDEMLSDIAFNRKVALMSEKAEREEFIRKGLEIGQKQGIEFGKQQGIEVGKQQGIEVGKQQGIEVGKQQGMEETIRTFIMKKYHQDASEWLQRCSQKELEKILDLIISDISYETLLKKIQN